MISKYLFREQIRPIDLLSLRTFLASIILFAWLALRAPRALRIRRSDLPYFFLLGIVGLAFNQYVYYLALDLTSVGYALLLQYTAPVFLLAYGALTATEKLTPGKVAAAAMALGGAALMVLGASGGVTRVSMTGTAFALGSALGFAFYTSYGQRGLTRYDARTVLAYAFLASAIIWLFLRPPWRLPLGSYDASTWLLILYLASFATVIPFGLYLFSLHHLEASRTNLTSMLEPVVAATLAWIWLGEVMTGMQIAGGIAVLAGLVLLQFEQAPFTRRLALWVQGMFRG